MSQLPIIFLAFANDFQQSYLHKLTEEQDAIRATLQIAEDKGLCEVVYETDTDINKIWKVFDRYQDRISIFHYAGHATDYSLLLKSASGKHQVAHAEGLVSFLGKQKGLKLVFINGCSSKRQAEELRDHGVPAVIGTARPIDDEMATYLSGKFYESLTEGRSLEQAWMGASDFVKAQIGDQGFSASTFMDDEDEEDGGSSVDFPWDLYIRPGSEQVTSWNLAQEARNPLFNLPLPESYFLRLRNSPFVGLHFFQEEDSALFFGRGAQIRALYNHLKGIHPIILLYGKSGVGKSSMLDAGLLPRIKEDYQSVYARRIQEKGLLGTLELALSELLTEQPLTENHPVEQEIVVQDQIESTEPKQGEVQQLLIWAAEKSRDSYMRLQLEKLLKRLKQEEQDVVSFRRNSQLSVVQLTSILKQWQAVEQQTGKPLVIILDQVEETYTRPMPESGSAEADELNQFLTAIQPLFSGTHTGIRGKLILSYRKEYHPEIRDTFQALALPYSELFLKRLDKEGIIEAIQGINQYEITRRKYQLHIEENLPALIADDLMEDSESPIAPVLQIILEKLWKSAYQAEHAPVNFTQSSYQELRRQGTTMDEFFQQQMNKLTESLPKEVSSGLALDILHQHTTNLGTAGSCKRIDLLSQYENPSEEIKHLIQALQDLSLLVRIDQRQVGAQANGEANYTTILAHDTIAPIVIRAYNFSNAPGQRAARILNNKLSDVGYRLSEEDTAQLIAYHAIQSKKEGYSGPKEIRAELEGEYIGPANFLTMLRTYMPEDTRGREEQQFLANARINLQSNHEAVYLAADDLAIVEQGVLGMPKVSLAGQQVLQLSEQKRAEASALAKRNKRRQRIFMVAISLALLVATALGFWATKKQGEAEQKAMEATVASLSARSRALATEDPTTALNLAMAAYKQIPSQESASSLSRISSDTSLSFFQTILRHQSPVTELGFSMDGKYILTGTDQGTHLWDFAGNEVPEDTYEGEFLYSTSYNNTGTDSYEFLPTEGVIGYFRSKEEEGRSFSLDGHTAMIQAHDFSSDETFILTGADDHTARLWDLTHKDIEPHEGKQIKLFIGHTDRVGAVLFSPDGQYILTGSDDGTARLWRRSNGIIKQPNEYSDYASIVFSPNGSQILVGTEEDSYSKKKAEIRLCNLNGSGCKTFHGEPGILAFSPDGQHIVNTKNNEASMWNAFATDVYENRIHFEGHSDRIQSISISVDGQKLLTTSTDNTARLWDIPATPGKHTVREFKTLNLENLNQIAATSFSPDGQFIVAASTDEWIRFYDLSGNLVQRKSYKGYSSYSGSDISIFPDGQSLLTTSSDYTVSLRDMDGYEIQQVTLPFNPNDENEEYESVKSVGFSEDGQYLLTASLWHLIQWPNLAWALENGKIHNLSAEEREHYGITWDY